MTDAEIVDALVKKLGTTKAVGDELKVTPAAVTNWRARNRVGWHMRPKVRALAMSLGIRVRADWTVQLPASSQNAAA